MKITIINGAPSDKWAAFDKALEETKQKLSAEHDVEVFTVRDMNIGYCVGCFGCWLKTPGKCTIKDDMESILKSIIHSDLQLCVSPPVAGFVSSETKKVMDREIPMILPFIRIIEGECHHPLRYDKMADFGIMLMDVGNLDSETKEIVFDTFDRLSNNLHCKRMIKHTVTPETLMEVIENETRAY